MTIVACFTTAAITAGVLYVAFLAEVRSIKQAHQAELDEKLTKEFMRGHDAGWVAASNDFTHIKSRWEYYTKK